MSRRDAERLEDILAAAEAITAHLQRGDIKGMRNHLAHRYFDTAHAIVADTITVELPPLVDATTRLLDSLTAQPGGAADQGQPGPG